MSSARLPTHIVAFLHRHVDHVVKLEFLLAVHAAPSSATSLGRVARVLDVPRGQVRDMAHELASVGLMAVSVDEVRLASSSVDQRIALSDLASWYARERTLVLDVLRDFGRCGA